ncbi:MAG: DUF1311 domain-containing protein, partial [Synergistaceae bacterium]|nr:DUF1311 domain-containing protein [Synergistaceae bacterium]
MRSHKIIFPVVTVLAVISSLVSSGFAASDYDMADKLVADGKVPMYVRDKGNFVYNPDFHIVGIKGYNVNLRSQPNTKANVVVQISDSDTDKWPVYLGEWTHPNGEYWVIGEYRASGKPKTVWIFGKFAEPMSKEEYSSAKKANTRLSDNEYRQMMRNSDFANADKALNQAWRNAKNSLSKSSFEALKKSQTSWINRGRDIEVKPLLAKMSRVEAYTSVTNARAEYINKFANGTTNLSSATNYENSGNIYDDVPDDLPDDLPDDVPSDSDVPNEDSSYKNNNAGKNINLNSSDDAADFLYERLI